MTMKQPYESAGRPIACPNLARRYLFSISPAGTDLVLLIALEVLLWIA